MGLLEVAQNIIDGHEYKSSTVRNFFGINKGARIKLQDQVADELFSELYNTICGKLGNPLYVHSYYGYIWENGGEFLAYNEIEEGYDYGLINFFVFNKLPRGKKLTYADYTQTVETISQIFTNNNLTIRPYDLHYHNKTFLFVGDSQDAQCVLYIEGHSLFFGYSQKEAMENGATKMKPCYARRKKILFNNLATLKSEIESCFIAE